MTDFLRASNKLTKNSGIPLDASRKEGRIIRKKIIRYIVKIGGNEVVIDDPDKLCEIINSLKTQSVSQYSEFRTWNPKESGLRRGLKDESNEVLSVNGIEVANQLQEISPNVRDEADLYSLFDKSEANNNIVSEENTDIPLMGENIVSTEIIEHGVGYQKSDVIKISAEKQDEKAKNADISLALQSIIQKNVGNTCLISIDEKDSIDKSSQTSKISNSTNLLNNYSSIRKIDSISTDCCTELNSGFSESLKCDEVLPYIKQIIDAAKIRSEKSFLHDYENSKNPNRNLNVDDKKHSYSLRADDKDTKYSSETDECIYDATSEASDLKNGSFELPGKKYIENVQKSPINLIPAPFYESDFKETFKDKFFLPKNTMVDQSIDALDLNEIFYFNKETELTRTRNDTSLPEVTITNIQMQKDSKIQIHQMSNSNCELNKSTTALDAINNHTNNHLNNFNSQEYDKDNSIGFKIGTFRTNLSPSFPCYDESEPDLYASGVDTRFQSGKIQSYPENDPVISLLQKTKDSLNSLLTTSDNIILQNWKFKDGFNGVFSESMRAPSPNSQCDSGNDDSRSHSPEMEEMTFEVHRNVDGRNDPHGQGKRISWSDKCWLPCIRESSIESLIDVDDFVHESKSGESSAEGLEPSHDILKQQVVLNKEKEMVVEQCPTNISNIELFIKNVSDTEHNIKADSECVLSLHGISKENILSTNAANYVNQVIKHPCNVPMTKTKKDGEVCFSINSSKDLALQSQYGEYNPCYSKVEDNMSEQKLIQCPSVKKVMKIFQQESDEPIDKWPGMEKNRLISPSRTRKEFIENLLDCAGKSESQSDEVFDSFKALKNENECKVVSIKDRVKIFENKTLSPRHSILNRQ